MTSPGTPSLRRKSGRYPPGLLYDLAFGGILKGVRRSVAAAVEPEGHFPWLDVCCGTGGQLRSRFVKPDGPTAVGLDLHRGMIRYAAARAPSRAFVLGDAASLPFKPGAFQAVSVTLGLHDKGPETRTAMMAEAKRVLTRGGRIIAADFEPPWSLKARLGAFFAWAIERLAGGEHYRNGRDFLRRGGLGTFLRENGFVELTRRDIAAGSIGVVVCRIGS